MARKKYPDRPGYELVGFAWSRKNPRTGVVDYPKNGRPFPIWRKIGK